MSPTNPNDLSFGFCLVVAKGVRYRVVESSDEGLSRVGQELVATGDEWVVDWTDGWYALDGTHRVQRVESSPSPEPAEPEKADEQPYCERHAMCLAPGEECPRCTVEKPPHGMFGWRRDSRRAGGEGEAVSIGEAMLYLLGVLNGACLILTTHRRGA